LAPSPGLVLAAFAASSYSGKVGGTATDPLIGSELAGYRIESLIGRGGMSVVYLAEDPRLGRRVALKLLVPELAGDERFRERFLRESRLAASLEHPNVLPIYDAGEVDGLLFIAMRHVEGRDLRSLLQVQGPLPLERALALVGQLAWALDSAHARGLVHRDVTPGNVLVAEGDHVYLCDFGLSRRVVSTASLTETGQLLGTLDYVAPEQIQGEDADGRADVYSLACVLYECLTGKPPFARDQGIAVLWGHVHEPPPAPSTARPELPAALDEIMARGLAKARAERFERCGELVAAARAAAASGGVTRPPARVSVRSKATEARKTVTVLFSDLRGSSASGELVDPEALRQGIDRYVEEAVRVLEYHGGSIERFAGGALVGVFGAPLAHEDDALRGVKAAVDLRARLEQLSAVPGPERAPDLVAHIGVGTGVAVVSDAVEGGPAVVGDVVNLAVRLGEAAEPNEILVSDSTYRLVAGAIAAEERSPAPAGDPRGGSRAWRVLELLPAAPPLQTGAVPPMIGRDAELGMLRHAFEQAVAEGGCRMVTVVGPPGIGKSRLAEALAEALQPEATILAGRCLSYGEGITYWPVAEIVRAAAGEDVRSGLARLLGGAPDGAQVAELVAATIGLATPAGAGEEPFWAVRRLLETLARERPLVVFLEDAHWAEPTLLDLLQHVARRTRDAPLLLVCLARPDLLDERPAFPTETGSAVVELQPLTDLESAHLVDRLRGTDALPSELAARVVGVAGGNPLFIEQLLAMADEVSGVGRLTLPPAIQALLAARLDRLPVDERQVIECASIEGLIFHVGALAELCRGIGDAALLRLLLSLTRKELVRPERSEAGDEALRFQHALVHEAAYQGIAKERRADLHEQFGSYLERMEDHAASALPLEEIVGYHLEQAVQYRREVGAVRDSDGALAARASDRLAAAGRRALASLDLPAAITLLERAAALLPTDSVERALLEVDRGAALADAGRLEEADVLLTTVEERMAGDRRVAANAAVQRLLVRYSLDIGAAFAQLENRGGDLERVLQEEGDHRGLYRLWLLRGFRHWVDALHGPAEGAWEHALSHARQAGDAAAEHDILAWLASAAFFGPTPADAGVVRCEAILEQVGERPGARAQVLPSLAGLHAMKGRFDVANALVAEAEMLRAEIGDTMQGAVSHSEALVSMLEGNLDRAERQLRAGYDRLERMGEKALLSSTVALLARVAVEQGCLDDAARHAEEAEKMGAAEDVWTQAICHGVMARVLAARGATEVALELARAAVDITSRTDDLISQGDAFGDLASVLDRAGTPGEARAAWENAAACYDRKGDEVSAARVRKLMASKT
jgi:serine/threonine protein kinase/tetratricopeptide (TPR) repeat protein